MKRSLSAGMLGLFLILRLLPAVSILWAERISLPLLGIFAKVGSLFPFVLLEWILGGVCALLLISLFQRRLLKILSGMILAALLFSLSVWYPLYFLPGPGISAGNEEISRFCEELIDELNGNGFPASLSQDLPAKFVRFPEWMDALGITGLCSFWTGEALVTPELDAVSLPFVAVHEAMHLRGCAGEGAANIAAWEECIARGGSYAASARVWALRYGMGILRRETAPLYEACLLRMNHETLQIYRKAGGAYSPVSHGTFLQRIYSFLGIETAVQDYEILAPYLAAKYAK